MVEPINPTATPQDPVAPVTPAVEPTPTPTPDPQTPPVEDPTLLGKKPDSATPEPGQKTDTPKEPGEEAEPGLVPDTYEIKLEEGMVLDQGTLDMFSPIFKELGLTNDGAQKLVNAYVPMISSLEERIKQQSLNDFKEIVAGWKTETLKQLGPDSDQKMAVCARAINQFGDDNFRAALDQTGLGNHPEFVKFMIKVGETIKEDTFIDPKLPTMPGQTDQEKLNKMYPTMK